MPHTARASVGEFRCQVINLGNARAVAFHEDGDDQAFLDLAATTCERLPMRVAGFCLMANPPQLRRLPLTCRLISPSSVSP